MKNIAILDYSMLRHVATASVKKHQELNSVEGHMRCVTQRMAEVLYSLEKLEKWDYLVIAQDARPYWRSSYMDGWYRENTKCIEHEGLFYWAAYSALYVEEDGKLVKVTKKRAATILSEGAEVEFPEDFRFFKYKGNRPAQDYSWLDCKPEEYFELMNRLPVVFTTLLGGAAISVEGAEADDIAGVLAEYIHSKGNRVTLISGDSDWAQMCAYYPETTYVNPFRDERIVGDEDGVLRAKLLAKIVGGDSGDNIRGCGSVSKYGPIGEAAAKKIVEAEDWTTVKEEYLALNKKLVRLHPDSIPEDITKEIMAALANPARTKDMPSWELLGVPERRRAELDLANTAKSVWELAYEIKEVPV